HALFRKSQKGLELDDELLRSALETWRQSLLINPKQPRVEANIQKWQGAKTLGRGAGWYLRSSPPSCSRCLRSHVSPSLRLQQRSRCKLSSGAPSRHPFKPRR